MWLTLCSMDYSPAWKAVSPSPSLQIACILWKAKTQYNLCSSPSDFLEDPFKIHLCLGLPSCLLPSDVPTNTLCEPLTSPTLDMSCLCHSCFITRTVFGEEGRSLSFSLCSLLHSPVTSWILGPDIFLIPYSQHPQPLKHHCMYQAFYHYHWTLLLTNVFIVMVSMLLVCYCILCLRCMCSVSHMWFMMTYWFQFSQSLFRLVFFTWFKTWWVCSVTMGKAQIHVVGVSHVKPLSKDHVVPSVLLLPEGADRVLHSYKTAGKIMLPYVLSFIWLGNKQEDKRFWIKWLQAFPEFNLLLISASIHVCYVSVISRYSNFAHFQGFVDETSTYSWFSQHILPYQPYY